MSRVLLDNDWEFALLSVDAEREDAAQARFTQVEIPHDWLIEDTENLYKSGCGWYKRKLKVPDDKKRRFLEFDGVYMDSTVYINGRKAISWRYGYSSFSCEITELLYVGNNEIEVQVRYRSPNSRWYSGAGIYRNVYLKECGESAISYGGVYISANPENGKITVSAETDGEYDKLVYTVLDAEGSRVASSSEGELVIKEPALWSVDRPQLYTLRTELFRNGVLSDSEDSLFGFRSIKLDPDEGFFLNGKYMKLKGVCLHHDLGALGAAVNYRATERQLLLMKGMGVNAVRTSHNMPSRELVEICDRIGMLIDSESFDMWELPKNEFDNARFFKETARADVLSWVKRDRNHPSVIMWSIGNEIYDTHASAHGCEIAESLMTYVREADPRCNAFVTIGSNFIEWEGAQKIGKMLGVSGYNYTEKCYDEHHAKYPETVIYGSETSSAVRSRGVYHFPADVPLLTHDDNQCSSLANSCVGWGRDAEDAWIQDRNRKFCAGQFVWTGIDYIGEPTPYSTKNSFFGAADTCCFPKDAYYLYKSFWFGDKPFVHLLPYWDFNVGQPVDILAYTNCGAVELFFNGKSLGRQKIDHARGTLLHGKWKMPYEKGELLVKAFDESGAEAASDIRRSFTDPVRLEASADRTVLDASGRDMCFVTITALDKDGTIVANARSRVSVQVSGCGRLEGMDNGDSTDYEQYKTTNRRLFSGAALAIIRADSTEGEIRVKITSEGLEPTEIVLTVRDISHAPKHRLVGAIPFEQPKKDIPVRKIEAYAEGGAALDENRRELTVKYRLLPENATFEDVTCKVVKANSVASEIASAELGKGEITLAAKGDGECILRIYASNGGRFPQVISDTAVTITGLGAALRSPYGMISASTYNVSERPLNIIENGALGGFTSYIRAGFTGLDFGEGGADRLTLYIGNCCNKDIPIEIFDGDTLIFTAMFPHNNGWGSFSPLEFTLPQRLRGVHELSFGIADKCIFGGFEFAELNRAYAENHPADSDYVYGDDYSVNGGSIEKIGNNVVIGFSGMDFSEGTEELAICGKTPNRVNTIQLRYTENGAQKTQLLEFEQADELTERKFAVEKICGRTDISFVFMPGSNFDFEYFRFEK